MLQSDRRLHFPAVFECRICQKIQYRRVQSRNMDIVARITSSSDLWVRQTFPALVGSSIHAPDPCPFDSVNGLDLPSVSAAPPPRLVGGSAAIRASLLTQQRGFRPWNCKKQISKKWLAKAKILLQITTLRMADESLVVDVVVVLVLGAPTKWRRSGGSIAARLSLNVWSSDLTLMVGLERALGFVKLIVDRSPLALTILEPCKSPKAEPGRAAREVATGSP